MHAQLELKHLIFIGQISIHFLLNRTTWGGNLKSKGLKPNLRLNIIIFYSFVYVLKVIFVLLFCKFEFQLGFKFATSWVRKT